LLDSCPFYFSSKSCGFVPFWYFPNPNQSGLYSPTYSTFAFAGIFSASPVHQYAVLISSRLKSSFCRSTAAPIVVVRILHGLPPGSVYSRNQTRGINGLFLLPLTGGSVGFIPESTAPRTRISELPGKWLTV